MKYDIECQQAVFSEIQACPPNLKFPLEKFPKSLPPLFVAPLSTVGYTDL